MIFLRKMAVQAIEDAKGTEHLEILGAEWYENRFLNLMDAIEDERDAAKSIGALTVLVAGLLETVRRKDPSYGLTATDV